MGAAVSAVISGSGIARRLLNAMPPGQRDEGATPEAAGGEGIDALPGSCPRGLAACLLFDEMPMERRREDEGAAAPSAGGSGIGVLPDSVLAHILGFLPAEEAVSTCVLARRWRHLWKSATGLRVVAADGEFLGTEEKLQDFVGRVLLLREGAPLDTMTYSCSGKTPILESMPSLVDAYVQLDEDSADQCKLWHPHYEGEDCGCESCQSSNNLGDDSYSCVLLKGLSEATNLMLISEPTTFIFRMDLRWCPTFSKLKTLLLNDYWCVPDDFNALSCILEHSPVLEKLTLLLAEYLEPEVELEGSINPTERSAAISEHLKKVEVKCEVVGERILKVIWFLRMFNIHVSGKSKSELLPHCIPTHVAGSF
ncbi:hypothetical protein ACP70R_003783 [Stipagrostis hirtigluma subsp. patula]